MGISPGRTTVPGAASATAVSGFTTGSSGARGRMPGGPCGELAGADKEYLDAVTATLGAVIGGRWTYEAADH